MALQLIFLAVCTLFLPICLGMLPVRFMKEENKTIGMLWVCGWFVALGLFQLLAVPFIVEKASFTLLVKTYTITICLLAAGSMVIAHDVVITCIDRMKQSAMEKSARIIMIAALVMMAGQIAGAFFMQYLDGDDAFFIGTSLTTQHTDTMYLFTPYYGANGVLDIRHALSPVPIFLAWLSEVTGMHVTILCHSFISMIFLGLMYCLYVQVADRLFPLQKRNKWLFVFFMNLWYLFGNISIYNAESFAFTRTWQGKAMFANIIVPALFLWIMLIAKQEMDVGEWAMLFVIVMSATLTTSTGIYSVPILLVLATAIIAVRQKRYLLIFQILACLVPSVFYGMLYLFLK